MAALKTYLGKVYPTRRIDMGTLRTSQVDFYVVAKSKAAAAARAGELGGQPHKLYVATYASNEITLYRDLGWLHEAGDIVFVSEGNSDVVARAYAGGDRAHFAGTWSYNRAVDRRVFTISSQDQEAAASPQGQQRHQLMLSLRPFDLTYTTTTGDTVLDEDCLSEQAVRDAAARLMADPKVAEIQIRRKGNTPAPGKTQK